MGHCRPWLEDLQVPRGMGGWRTPRLPQGRWPWSPQEHNRVMVWGGRKAGPRQGGSHKTPSFYPVKACTSRQHRFPPANAAGGGEGPQAPFRVPMLWMPALCPAGVLRPELGEGLGTQEVPSAPQMRPRSRDEKRLQGGWHRTQPATHTWICVGGPGPETAWSQGGQQAGGRGQCREPAQDRAPQHSTQSLAAPHGMFWNVPSFTSVRRGRGICPTSRGS